MAEPEFTAPEGTRLTQSEDGKRLYIHIKSYPFLSLAMKNLADKIAYAQFLHDGSEVLYTLGKSSVGVGDRVGTGDEENTVFFKLPPVKPHCLVPVIEVFLK
jgi:alpha-L-fucosidase